MTEQETVMQLIAQYRNSGGNMGNVGDFEHYVNAMGADGRTPLGLNQWQRSDKPVMEDFNEDNRIIDTELRVLREELSNKANVNSPDFTGTPTAPTAEIGVTSQQIATTAFVRAALVALGLGSTAIYPPDNDCNKAVQSGFYRVSGSVANSFSASMGSTSSEMILVIAWNISTVAQISILPSSVAIGFRSTAVNGAPNNWGTWKTIALS